MSSYVLELRNIKKSFGQQEQRTEVLKGIDLRVSHGEFITLLGASGCGKTTTLRIIAGLEETDEGQVFLDEQEITGLKPDKRDVNTVFQNYALFPNMSVAENIAYGLKVKRVPKAERMAKAEEMLAMVQLEGYGRRRPSELSGGQKQRVAIARAVVNQPKVLLLDEPLGALDYKLRKQMQLELKRLQKKLGITFIYITHDQEEAINMSDRIVVMHDGLFEQIGSPNEIYYHPKTSYVADFVGNANIYHTKNGTYAVRTENILINETKDCFLNAQVLEKSFQGGQLRIQIRLEDGQQMMASRSGIDYAVNVGEKIRIGWHKDMAVPVIDNISGEGAVK